MGTRYNIAVTATDLATARVRAIKQTLGSVVSPITNVGKSIKALGKETGINTLATGLGKLGGKAAEAVKSIGGLSPAMGSLIGAGGIVGLATYGRELLYAQSSTLRFSQISGVAAERVQTLEGAAKLAGLSAQDMDSALLNVGSTLQDAKWGRNQGALLLMNRLGIQMKQTKTGAIDSAAAIGDLAEILGPGGKLANQPVQTKQLLADQFGVGVLLPILLKGRRAWEDYQAAANKAKTPISQHDLEIADQYRQNVDAMTLSFENLANTVMHSAMPSLGAISKWVADNNQKSAENIRKMGLGGAIWSGTKKFFQGKWGTEGKNLADTIGAGEGGYNSINLGKAGGYKSAKTDLEHTTIGQVMADQNDRKYNAAGKYQLTRDTLSEAVSALKLNKGAMFNQQTQDDIFERYLLSIKRPEIGNFIHGKDGASLRDAQKAAAREWASIKDPDTGKGVYDKPGQNKATIDPDVIANALRQARRTYMVGQESKEIAKVTSIPGKLVDAARDSFAKAAASTKPGTAPAPQKPDGTAPQVSDSDPDAKPDSSPTGTYDPNALKPKSAAAKVDGQITVVVQGLPKDAKASVTQTKGPVKTTLKVESSMPDFSL